MAMKTKVCSRPVRAHGVDLKELETQKRCHGVRLKKSTKRVRRLGARSRIALERKAVTH
jgi:hypothetical protein